jgi:large subunit ribosomal protein L24
MKVRKGDEVVVVSGDDRGKRGKILRVVRDKNRVIVEGVNFIRRHTRPNQASPQGGIVEREAPVHVSNVMLVDPKGGRPTRVGTRVHEDGARDRVARRSGEILPGGRK